MATIIDGKKIAAQILERLKDEVAALGFRPKLVDILVGDDPVTESYVKIKSKRAAEIGIDFEIQKFPATVGEDELVAAIERVNSDPNVRGLITQLPLPEHIDKQRVLDSIDRRIDVDVLTAVNLGKLFTGQQEFTPPTAAAIMKILDEHKVPLAGARVCVVGAGDLVGKPVAFLLMQRQATVTIANASTKNLSEITSQADVLISGTGQPQLITGAMVKDGAVVIDAGTAEWGSGISGDVDFDSVSHKASLLSPVPGGVGPVTVAMLLANTVEASKKHDRA